MSVCSILISLLIGGAAQAQTAKPAAGKPAAQKTAPQKPRRPAVAPRACVALNAGYQATSNDFSSSWTFDYYADTTSATAEYPVKASFLFDAGGGARIWRDLMLGASLSVFSRSDTVSMTASVPHPFNFTFREATGSQSGIGHGETGVHLQATWVMRPRNRVYVGLSAGPTIYSVRQDLVSKPTFIESYPYDSVSIGGAITAEHTATAVGFNVGADAWYMLSKNAGVGFLVRYSRATANFEAPDKSGIAVRAGGLQLAAGLRVRVPEGKKPKPPAPGPKSR
jgi:hypothetical protein